MTTYFDLLGAQNRDHGERGIARLVSQLTLAIERSHPTAVDQYIVHPHLPLPAALEPLISTGKLIRSVDIDQTPSAGGVFICGSVVELDEMMEVVLPHWARGAGWQSLAILYDLIPLRFTDEYLADDSLRARYLDRVSAYGLFDHLLPISATSRDDASELLGFPTDRQTVIYAGVDERFHPAPEGARGPAIDGVRDGYVLFPTGMDWRKNVDRTIEAYGALPPEVREKHQLVLACRLDPWMEDALRSQAESAGLSPDQLALPGYLNDDQLVALYQHAELAVFPSLYEGFGLPALEAMRCGAPTICANNSSLREVQTLDKARFDGSSVESITAALHRALTDADFRQEVRDHPDPGFSWSRSADLLVGAVSSTFPARQRPRLAVVSPLPPQASGIATYTDRLVSELAALVDVTVFTSTNEEEGEVVFEPVAGAEVLPLAELALVHNGGHPFDEIVYMMGNSRFHASALESLRETGGCVLFHDARLTGMYNEMYRLDPATFGAQHVGAKLAEMYPARYRDSVVAAHTIEPHEAHRFGIQMTREVASLASRRFCHSAYAAQTIYLDTGAQVEHLFDMPVPEVDAAKLLGPADLVCVFGIVDPAKRASVLIEACTLVVDRRVTLRFVGECDPAFQSELQDHADSAGLDIEFTGYVSDAELLQHQLDATLAIQLRQHTNGESSGAVAELLAAQTPTIVTRIGAMAELPAEAVRFVEPEASALDIAGAITGLLGDPHGTLRMQEAARRYAESHTYAAAARSLVEALALSR